MIQKILSEIEGRLQEAGIPCRVSGREKHLYSIYCKMVLKEQRFHSIMDIYAFRVIVHDPDICYRVLGQMHSLYKPRRPFQRLHRHSESERLSIFAHLDDWPHGVPVEVQIRTEDMDQMAEMGVAAHWAYKEHGAKAARPRKSALSAGCKACWNCSRAPVARLNLSRALNPICSRMRFTFSPRKGALSNCLPAPRRWTSPTRCIPISAMPASARASTVSPIRCRNHSPAARLSKSLPRRARPNAAWLNFVVSSKARAKIRQLLKNLKRDDSVSLGRRLLNHALGGSRKLAEIPPENIQRELDRMKLATLDDLLAEIGLGNAMSVVVAKNLQQGEASAAPVPANASNHGHLPIKGADGVLITFAKCCRPIPGIRSSPTSAQAKGWLSTMNPVVTSAATRKSLRSLWRSNGIKKLRRNLSPKLRWICSTTGRAG